MHKTLYKLFLSLGTSQKMDSPSYLFSSLSPPSLPLPLSFLLSLPSLPSHASFISIPPFPSFSLPSSLHFLLSLTSFSICMTENRVDFLTEELLFFTACLRWLTLEVRRKTGRLSLSIEVIAL